MEVMETYQTKHVAGHPDTLTSMANLTYRERDRLDEPEALELEVLEMSKTKLGTDHPLR
jgi:hypothetical protein